MESLPDNAAHILVVDDDQRIRDTLAQYLFQNGYRVTTAADAATARAYLNLPNVLCVGGSWVAPREAVAARDWPRITALARAAAALGVPAK